MEVVRVGVGRVVVVAVALVIIVGAAGAYILLAGTSPGTSASTTLSASTSTSTAPSTSVSSASTTSFTSNSASSTSSSSSQSSSSSSTSSSSAPTSSTSSQSASCTTTASTTTGSLTGEFNFTGFLTDFSSMTINWIGAESGSIYNVTSSHSVPATPAKNNVTSTYTVLATTPEGFRVNVTTSTGGTESESALFAWRNGSAGWVFTNGANETGPSADSTYLLAMWAFTLEPLFTSPEVTSVLQGQGLVHAAGSSMITLGPTPVNATVYAPNALPMVSNACSNPSVDFTRFSLQLGTVAGKDQLVLTNFDLAGTLTNAGSTLGLDGTFAVTSLTMS